jgi:preprotein translocase subunit SecA
MRVFGGDRIGAIMNTLNLPDDMPIENKVISRSLETAQKRVEGHNFDIRKHLVEYDDVMNSQREIIYAKRRKYLEGKELRAEIEEMFSEELSAIVASQTDARTGVVNLQEVQKIAGELIPLDKDWATKLDTKVPELITDDLMNKTKKAIDKRQSEVGNDLLNLLFKMVCLKTIDSAWLQHLETMEHLREGIGLRGYGQRDPLVEYKAEAYRLFNSLLSEIRFEVVNTVLKVNIQVQPEEIENTATEITEGAQQAEAALQQSVKRQAKSTEVKTRKTSQPRPDLRPMRKKSKKKKKKKR